MLAKECFRAGELARAVEAATEEVKERPGDISRRRFLSELLCFAGDLERADVQLEAASELDPKQAVGVALFRQLIRAERARQEFYSQGRLPEFLDSPGGDLRHRLEAWISLREEKPGDAASRLSAAELRRPRRAGVLNGEGFEDLRDLDDLTASFFEVLTTSGKYYWIPFEKVELVAFEAPSQPLDLLWRRARMEIRGGPDAEVYVPALYAGSESSADDEIKLGRRTDFVGGSGSPVRGIGRREVLVAGPVERPDDGVVSIMEVERIEFKEAAGANG